MQQLLLLCASLCELSRGAPLQEGGKGSATVQSDSNPQSLSKHSSPLMDCVQGKDITGLYAAEAPVKQATVDIFAGSWVTKLPGSNGSEVKAGDVKLYEDPRVLWGMEKLAKSKLAGKKVLELGPLEASHTYLMHKLGAQVTAVEGNAVAYLKCLVVKEEFGLDKAHFKYGDVQKFIEKAPAKKQYDIVVASGILYHLQHPVEIIAKLSKLTDQLYIWTQVYNESCHSAPELKERFRSMPAEKKNTSGYEYGLHRYHYADAQLTSSNFAGGMERTAMWMEEGQLVDALKFFGFKKVFVKEAGDQPNAKGEPGKEKCAPNGGHVTLVASKK